MKYFYSATLDKHFKEGESFQLLINIGNDATDLVTFPNNWLANATSDDLSSIGLVEVTEVGVRGDPELVDISEELVGAELRITSTPKAAEVIRSEQLKKIAPLSPRQIRQALTRAGLRQLVEAAVSAGDQDLKDWWEFATLFERNHPQVIAMGAALGQSEEQLDQLWKLGASL